MAPDVALRARSSSTWPRRTSVTITAAASKYTGGAPPWRTPWGKAPGASTAKTLQPNAAAVPRAISVNMFRLRVTSDCQPRTKKGQPPQSTTGRRQQELNPDRRGRVDPPRQGGRDHLAHRERKDGDGQDQAHPEPPGHVDQLGARPLVGGERIERLEGHPALGASAGSDLADLRVHGTRVYPRVGMAPGGRRGRRGARNFAGSATNRSRQLGLQNQYVVPACSALPPSASPGVTSMPQTGSITVAAAACALPP
jgi:hypothetical protein